MVFNFTLIGSMPVNKAKNNTTHMWWRRCCAGVLSNWWAMHKGPDEGQGEDK